MKTLILASAMVFGLSACGDYFSSPEKKAFDAFVAKCKADSSTADCQAWKDSTTSPGGN